MSKFLAISLLPAFAIILLMVGTSVAQGIDPEVKHRTDVIQDFRVANPEIVRLASMLGDGENIVLATVNGEAITTEGVRLEEGSDFDAQVDSTLNRQQSLGYHYSRREIEAFLMLNQYAPRMAIKRILLREAARASLTIAASELDVAIDELKDLYKISREDFEGWALFVQQRFNKSPQEFRETIEKERLADRILSLMAGQAGPISGIELPVFYSAEVKPSQIRREYTRTKTEWSVIKNIQYAWVGIEYGTGAPATVVKRLQDVLVEARTRIAKGESLESVAKNFLEAKLQEPDFAKIPGLVLSFEPEVKVESDDKLDEIGDQTRGLEVGEISFVFAAPSRSSDNARQMLVFARLDKLERDVSRSYTDPVVQETIRNRLRRAKLNQNKELATRSLLKNAIIFPDKAIDLNQ